MRIRKTWLFCFILLQGTVYAQEKTTALQYNPVMQEASKNILKSKSLKSTLIELPFLDDFASTTIFPDPALWADKNVFINSDFADHPLSIGVATFDALDSAGMLYPKASRYPFGADTLTSLPVDLAYPPSDSIYLSFFYQPQGKGDAPEKADSLKLEFYSPLLDRWIPVFGIPGDTLHPFKQVMIPVKDTNFLQTGFRFRFVNIASLAATAQDPGKIDNDDHWNLDYVRLDKNRSYTDTIVYDVALTSFPDSVMYKYTSIPWKHYPMLSNTDLRSNMGISYRNNFDQVLKVDRSFSITSAKYAYHDITTSENISPDTSMLYFPDFEKLPWTSASSATFRVRAWLTTDTLSARKAYRWNDTVSYHQIFSNYYSYDDGSAESGYGLTGEGTIGARFAMKFIAPFSDTLCGLKMYFNESYKNANLVNFQIAVWNDNNGIPGDLIFVQDSLSLLAQYSGLNHFITYPFPQPVMVPATFYVGWIQTSETFLNLGFDKNKINNDRAYYNIDGTWYGSQIPGTVMIRPIIGRSISTGISKLPTAEQKLRISPNPANSVVYIETETDNRIESLKIFDLQGKTVLAFENIPSSIDVSVLKPGLYIVSAESAGRMPIRSKLLIVR